MNLYEKAREEIRSCVGKAVEKAGYPAVEIAVEEPRERAHGDFSANTAMLLTKAAKQPPRVIAQAIIDHMDTEGTYIDSVEIAGPGFINFRLSERWLAETVPLILEMGDDYGRSDFGKGEKVMVEFVSANPTGPMHMGNSRGGALGDSLAAVLDYAGYDVYREFYLNDAGNQIEKFGNSLDVRYLQEMGEDIPFPEDGYQGEDIRVLAREFIALHGDKHYGMSSEERKKELVAFGLEKNVAYMKATLESYRIRYDKWFCESELYKTGEVDRVIELLKETGKTYEKEGALWLRTSEDGEKDEVLVRANGIPTYYAADIAYHRNKIVERGFNRVIDVWGADHHGHVARMKTALDIVGAGGDKLEVVLMQLVRLLSGGEAIRQSKRSGKAITLDVLLQEIGVDAARFFFNMRNAGSHFDFDLDLAVEQSNNNPVFYVQYAYARICSILRLLAEEGVTLDKNADVGLLKTEPEEALLRRLVAFPEEIVAAAKVLEPSRMTRYAMDLATDFHSFYGACKVKGEDQQLMHARIALITAVQITLKNVLTLLGVTAPEKM